MSDSVIFSRRFSVGNFHRLGDVARRILRGILVFALSVAGIAFPMGAARAADNPIVIENQNAGTTAWRLGQAGYLIADDTNRQVEGYASATSVNKGESLDFFVSVKTPQNFTADIYRLGYYGGKGGRLMGHVGPIAGIQQAPCPTNATTGLVSCAWSSSFSYAVPTTWTSGIYLATLTTADKYQRYVTFVVRDDQRASDFLYQQAVTTYQAYNVWPVGTGKSLYDFNSYGATVPATGGKRAAKVTFDRPYADGYGAGQLIEPGWGWERYYLTWLEQSGYDVSYSTNLDTHANGSRILNHKAFLSAGHDEYWSRAMVDAVSGARDSGVDLGFFGSNTAYWQVRFEASASGRADRIMTCYKSASLDPVKDNTAGVLWRDPPASSPEQTLVGVQYTSHLMNEGAGAMYIVQNSANWVWQGTGLTDGTAIPGILGYETDAFQTEYPAPVALSRVILADSPVTDAAGVPGRANSSIYQAPSGAWVFASGTNHWSYGLGKPGVADGRIQQATKNILNRFIDYVPPPPSAPAAPSAVSASGLSGSSIDVTWQDNSDNELGFVVERSIDDGATWTVLTPTLPVNATVFHDTSLTGGVSYSYRVKAVNDIGPSPYAASPAVTLPPASSIVFSENFTGPDGSSWSASRWTGAVGAGAWDIQANAGRMAIANVSNDRVQARALMPMTLDTETLTSVRYSTTGPRGYFYIFGRGSGDWVAGYPGTSYFLQLTNDGSAAALWKSVNGVTTQLVSNATAAAVTTTKQWVRLRVNGSSISAKIWTDGTAEPAAWELSTTDTTITSPGVLQVRMYRSGSSTDTREAILDDLVVTNLAPIVLPPPAPSALAAKTVSSTAIDLSWQDNATTETAYTVERSSDGQVWTVLTSSLPANTVQYRDTGLTAGASYRYRVRAENAGGSSPYSAVVQAATGSIPAAPSGLSITDRTFETVNLSWTDNAANETAYVLERSPQGATDWVSVELPAGTTSWRDTGLASSTTYNYRVKARNEVGDSQPTAIVTVTTLPPPLQPPVAPTNLSATAVSATTVSLTWLDNAGNETAYALDRSTDGGLTWVIVNHALAVGTTTFNDTGLSPETTYTYRVRAENAAGVSAWSAPATATTYQPPQPPNAPSGLVAQAISRSEIDLAWTDNATTESGYRVDTSSDAGVTWTLLATLPVNTTSYRVSNLLAETSYAYRVVATNEAGASAPSNVAQATTLPPPPPPPTAPTSLTANAVSANAVQLAWTDNATNETGYAVERSGDAGVTWTAVTSTLPADSTGLVDAGVQPGLTYQYRVRAINADGTSSWSNVATVTVPPEPVLAPSALTATATSAWSVSLTWLDNATNETAYVIARSSNGGVSWTTLAATLPAGTTSFRDNGLNAATTYTYRVQAKNAGASSAAVLCQVTTRSLLFSDVFTGGNGKAWSATKWSGSAVSGSWTIQSNAGRMRLTSSSLARVQVAAKMTPVVDSELLTSVRFSTTGTPARLDLFGRASGDWVNGTPTTAYFLRIANNSAQLQLWATSAGTDTVLATAPTGGAVTTTKQWVRIRVQGDTVSARVWTDGTPEPAAWEISATSARVLTAGILQARFTRTTSTGGTCDVFLDDLQVMP